MKNPTVVIPLGEGSNWEDNEIRYMLRSIDKYFQFDYDVVIYCTKKIDWLNCKQKIVKRSYPEKVKQFFNGIEHYENYYDVINKIKTALEDDDVSDEFFFMYDDVILLYDLYLQDIRRVCAGHHYDRTPKIYENRAANKWFATVHQSMDICKNNGYSKYNYETHLPRYFKKNLLRYMFKKHNIEQNYIPYAISTVYYNMYYKEPDMCYQDTNTIKAGFYGRVHGNDSFKSDSDEAVQEAIKDKTWINYSNEGLTTYLKEFIINQYTEKSRWEE